MGIQTYMYFYFVFYIVCHVNFCEAYKFKLMVGSSLEKWNNAQAFCLSKHGYLATLEDLTKPQWNENITNQDVWLGHYKKTSSWIDIVGCFAYSVNVAVNHFIPVSKSPAVCEQLCQSFTFFGLKDGDCVCFNNFSDSNLDLQRSASDKCNYTCNQQTGLCGGRNHITIFKRVNATYRSDPCSGQRCDCIQSETGGTKVSHFNADCNRNINALCRKGTILSQSASWTKALNLCRDNKSLPYRYSDLTHVCNVAGPASFWTSAFRQYVELHTNWTFFSTIEVKNVNECMAANFEGENYTTQWINHSFCDLEEKQFYCATPTENTTRHPTPSTTSVIIPTNISTLTTESSKRSSRPTITTKTEFSSINISSVSTFLTRQTFSSAWRSTDSPSRSNDTETATGPVIGAISAFLILAGIIAIIVYIKRRRNVPSNYSAKSDKSNTKDIYPEPEEGKLDENIMQSNGKLSSGHELANPINSNEQSSPSDNKDNSSYELANIVNDNDNDYAYRDTEEGEYDLLNENTKRKITENSIENNTYVHTGFKGDNEDTYDSTYNKNFKKEDYNSYDTTRFTIKDNAYDITKNSDENPYDHTNI